MGLKESGLRGSLRNVSVGIDAIPDRGIVHEWQTSEGSGDTVTDTVSGADITLSGASWDQFDNWWDGWAIDYDGDGDYGVVDNENRVDIGQEGSLIMTIRFDTLDTDQNDYAFGHRATDNDNRIYFQHDTSGNFLIRLAEPEVTLASGDNDIHRWGVAWNEDEFTAYFDGQPQGTSAYSGTFDPVVTDWVFGAIDAEPTNPADVTIDYPRVSDVRFSDEEMQEDYEVQPWVDN